MLVAAYIIDGVIYLHRQTAPDALEIVAVRAADPHWLAAAEAVQHFAGSADPLPDLDV